MAEDRRPHVPLDDSDLKADNPPDNSAASADQIQADGTALTSTRAVGGLGTTSNAAEPDAGDAELDIDDPGFSGRILDTDAPLLNRDTELPE